MDDDILRAHPKQIQDHLKRLMSQPLPATLPEAKRWYVDLQQAAEAIPVDGAWTEVEAWLGRNDLFYFLAVILRRPDVMRDWLFARCREVQAAPDGHLDLWAREHYKSTIITFALSIQDIIKDPETTIGIFSHTRPIAKAFLRQIKMEIEMNEDLKRLYPEVFYDFPGKQSPKWSEDDGIVVRRSGNPKEATVEAWGLVDGQPTGRHFKIRVYDDVVTRESVTTADQIEKTTRAWELSDNLGVDPANGGKERYIGTRYALYDTYSTMIVRKVVTERRYPATHNGRFDGHPVLLSETVWSDKVRKQGRTTIAAQLLQNPMADEGASFLTSWLQSYEVRPKTLNVYIMCDPSKGKSATSDNTAIAIIGVAAGGAKFLLGGVCHRMPLSERWRYLRYFYHKWSATPGVQHVGVGYERYGAQSDDEYFQEQMQIEFRKNKDPKCYFPIEELSWPREGGESKKERVERLEPDFRNGRFYLPLMVLFDGKPHKWRIDTDPASVRHGDVEWLPGAGMTKSQLNLIEAGFPELICQPLIVRDPNTAGGRYDLTVRFIEEYTLFPFGLHKDLVDATSRIYDMEPLTPTTAQQRQGGRPEVYVDGV